MRRTCTTLLLTSALLATAPAHAYAPEETTSRRTEGAGRTLLAQKPARASRAAIVLTRRGRTIFSVGDQAMRPASVIKLFTTTSAIVRFGPDHRFTTRVLRDGADLILVGGGDPTLANEAYRRERFLPGAHDDIPLPAFKTPSPTMEDLAAAVARAGVRSVTRLIGDEGLFDSVRTQAGWPARYLGVDPLTGLLSALTVNEGRADVKGKHLSPNPPLAAVDAFATALRARGVSVGATSVGRSRRGAREIASVRSPPMREVVDFVNRYSINFQAEILLKHLGARATGLGTTAAGVAEVRAVMRELKVPVDGLVMADGSGLSELDLLRPGSAAALLQQILTRKGPTWDALRASVPAAGGPGTLRKRMRTGSARGNLHAKTGSVRSVRAMAGWVTPADGVPVIFVVMFNRSPNIVAFNGPFDLFGPLLVDL